MMYFTEFPIVQAIGWTLLHAIWQGLLIALVLRLLLLLIPNRAAVLRYGLSVGAIFLMLLWAAVTCWQHLPVEGSLISVESTPLETDGIPDSNEVLYSSEEISAEISAFSLKDVSNHLQPFLPYFVGIWLLGVLLWSLRFMGSMFYLYRLPRRHVWQPDAAWQRKLISLQKKLAISQRVRLLISGNVQEPLTMGFLRPVILIPASLLSNLPPDQIEAILLHELAHIRRADYIVNLLLSIVEILFFYHPAYWWIARQVKLEREHCCDDQVLKKSGDQIAYAQALIAVQRLSITHQNHLVMNFSGNKSQFTYRIQRLFGQSHKTKMAPGLSGLGILSFCLLLFVFSPFHQDLKAQDQTTNAKSEVVLGEETYPSAMEDYYEFTQAEGPIKLTVTDEEIHILIDLLGASKEDISKLKQELIDLGVAFELSKSIPEPDWFEMEITYKEKHSKSQFRNAGLVDLTIARNPEEGKTSIGYSLGPVPKELCKPGQEGVEMKIVDFPKTDNDFQFDTETVRGIEAEPRNEFILEEIAPQEEIVQPDAESPQKLSVELVEAEPIAEEVISVENVPREPQVVKGELVPAEHTHGIKLEFDTMAWITLDQHGNEKQNQFIMGPTMEISVKDKAKAPHVLLIQSGNKSFISWEQFEVLNETIPSSDIKSISMITGKAAEKRYGDSKMVLEVTLMPGVNFFTNEAPSVQEAAPDMAFSPMPNTSEKAERLSADAPISNWTIFPNPSNGQVNFDFEVKQAGKIEIHILNLQGQVVDKVYQGSVEASRQLFTYTDTEDRLSNGMYVMQVKMGDAVISKKFVVKK
jgi:beta-lactamase regulating signal transducer with metallopeptidase domain